MFIAISNKPILSLALVALLFTNTVMLHEARGAGEPSAPAVQKTPQPNAPWQRDPFIKTRRKAISAPSAKYGVKLENREVTLQGIMKVNDKYFAIINGRVVGVGNKFEGITVKRISRTAVIIEDETGINKIDIYKGLVR
jgi:hypothetical protein